MDGQAGEGCCQWLILGLKCRIIPVSTLLSLLLSDCLSKSYCWLRWYKKKQGREEGGEREDRRGEEERKSWVGGAWWMQPLEPVLQVGNWGQGCRDNQVHTEEGSIQREAPGPYFKERESLLSWQLKTAACLLEDRCCSWHTQHSIYINFI